MTDALLVVAAYLVGSISFSYLIVRLRQGVDVRTRGSGNAGATNVLRVAGPGPAVAALLLDVAKGVAPVLVARRLGADAWIVGATGIAAVLGHVFPLYHGLRGGKGVATAAGALGTLAPVPGLLAIATFALVVTATRYVSLGSITAAALYPFLVGLAARLGWIDARPGELAPLVACTAAIAAVVLWKHRSNVARLRQGTERRLGERRA